MPKTMRTKKAKAVKGTNLRLKNDIIKWNFRGKKYSSNIIAAAKDVSNIVYGNLVRPALRGAAAGAAVGALSRSLPGVATGAVTGAILGYGYGKGRMIKEMVDRRSPIGGRRPTMGGLSKRGKRGIDYNNLFDYPDSESSKKEKPKKKTYKKKPEIFKRVSKTIRKRAG